MTMDNLTSLVAVSFLNNLFMPWDISFLNWHTSFPSEVSSSSSMIIPTRISTTFNCRKRGLLLSNLSSSSQPESFRSKGMFALLILAPPKRMSSFTISMVLFILVEESETGRVLKSLQTARKIRPSTEPKHEMAISRRQSDELKSIGLSLISSKTFWKKKR